MEENNKLGVNGNGKKIKIRLIELGMTQIELAEKIGANSIYLNHIISGYRPGNKYIKAIENILKISLEGIKDTD